MKKFLLITVCMVLFLVLLSGCNKNKQNGGDNTNNVPTTQPTVTPVAAEPTQKAQETKTVADYYPLLADTEYIYTGDGSEYASFNRYTDFIDEVDNRIQIRTDNGGTETVKVIEIKDGMLSVIKAVNECYYRDNFIENLTADGNSEVLLKEPLVQGTEWTLADGSKRSISAVDVPIETPSGNYQALEVTTQYSDSVTKDYYAPQVGLVKSIFNPGDSQVTSTLSEIKTNTPFTQTLSLYYPDSDEKIHVEPVTLNFKTNDNTRQVIQDTICKKADNESYLPLASTNTKINSLYLGTDNIVYVDFSPELVTDMNAGSGIELSILQCITNTLGNYYGTDQVYITVDGKPYESGHIQKKQGETFKVDLSNVVS